MPPDGPPLDVDPAVDDPGRPGPLVRRGRRRRAGERLLGIALDVGTTTVVLQVLDLRTGEALAVGAFENPQRFGGSDVIGRISYEAERPGELRRSLRRALNHELARIYAEHGIERHDVLEVVVVGNATMRDLVLRPGRRPDRALAVPERRPSPRGAPGRRPTSSVVRLAHELGVLVHPRARVWGAPLIACHVGADAAADLVPTGMLEAADPATSTGPAMLVDVGTNTEVVITDGRRVLAASCPAGPAFEGGLVRFGMPGSEGAVEAARHEAGGWVVRTIGDVEPRGDLRVRARRHPRRAAPDRRHDPDVGVHRRSDRGRHRARAGDHASRVPTPRSSPRRRRPTPSACACCCAGSASAPGDLAALHLAGGFASHLDVPNAQRIGFLPPVPRERVVQHGNASVRGAAALLLSRRARARLEAFVGRIEHVELEAEPDFFDLFVDGLRFEPLPSAVEASPA